MNKNDMYFIVFLISFVMISLSSFLIMIGYNYNLFISLGTSLLIASILICFVILSYIYVKNWINENEK